MLHNIESPYETTKIEQFTDPIRRKAFQLNCSSFLQIIIHSVYFQHQREHNAEKLNNATCRSKQKLPKSRNYEYMRLSDVLLFSPTVLMN